MSDDLGGFAEWRDKMEARVSTLEVTVKTEARVRATMDRDMSDLGLKLDVQGRLLQAVAETQSDHTVRLTRLEVGQADHTARLNRLETGQAKILAGVQTIVGLLDRQEDLPD
jgi:hypothetical protein